MAFKRVKRKESFAQWYIDNYGEKEFEELIEYNKEKNNLVNMWKKSSGSETHIWMKCKNKSYHENFMSMSSISHGGKCKYCGRTKYVHPKDSLGQYIIDNFGKDFLNNIWSDKNEKSPFKYSIGTEKKVWFKCLNGIHEDKLRQVNNSVRNNFICPFCSKNFNVSQLEIKIFNYLKSLNYTVNRENSCTIVPKNPKTNRPLPFDNEIKELKLIIEVNGRQHYKEIGNGSKWLNGMNTNEYLHNRKLKDRYKRIIAKQNGYYYLEIPYWTDNKNEEWKQLIDNKIMIIKKEGATTEI